MLPIISTFESTPGQCCPQFRNLVSKPEIARPISRLLPRTADSVPHRTNVLPNCEILSINLQVLSPNPNLLTRTAGCKHKKRNWRQESSVGNNNGRLRAQKSQMRNKKLPTPIKSCDWEQFSSTARPISQL